MNVHLLEKGRRLGWYAPSKGNVDLWATFYDRKDRIHFFQQVIMGTILHDLPFNQLFPKCCACAGFKPISFVRKGII